MWTQYARELRLNRIEYGTHVSDPESALAPARVWFTNSDRCVTSSCGTHDATNWPDTPWDLQCLDTSCANNPSPSFWSTTRVSRIVSQVSVGSLYQTVDQWDLVPSFPSTGDGSSPVLWLYQVTHTGKAGGADVATPSVTFYGTRKQNRADFDPSAGMASHNKWRMSKVLSESGRQTEVTYAADDPDCHLLSSFPNPDQNEDRCFPQMYTNPSGQTGWSWWHKRIVTKVVETDTTGGAPPIVRDYTYSTASSSTNVLWAYDVGSRVWGASTGRRSWANWRGYTDVTETVGPAGGVRSQKRTVYYRGLHGDRTDTGTRSVTVQVFTGSGTSGWVDTPNRAGRVATAYTYTEAGGQVQQVTRFDPWVQTTGTRSLSSSWAIPSVFRSQMTGTSWEILWVADDTGTLTQRTSTHHIRDNLGRVVAVEDKGNAAAGDETCATYTYAPVTGSTLRMFNGEGFSGFADTSRLVGNGWGDVTALFGPGDLDGDGNSDFMYRKPDGKLYMYRGDGAGGVISPAILMGSGWNIYDILLGPGDLDGDGHDDVVGRKPNGELILYPGTGVATSWSDWAEPALLVGTGWDQFDYLSGIGDLDGDGNDDVLVRRPDGELRAYLGNGSASGWFSSSAHIGTGWGVYDELFSPGDMDGDGNPELIARRSSDQVVVQYAGNGSASGWFKSVGQIGGGEIGYGSDIVFSPGDFDGDGVGDVIARHDSYIANKVEQVTTTSGTCGSSGGTIIADTRYSYDGADFGLAANTGHVSKTEDFDGTGWITRGTAVFDLHGQVTSAADALGRTTTTTYTENAQRLTSQITVTNPAGHITSSVLDVTRGLPLSVTDSNGKTTTGSYDALGRLVSVTGPGNTTGLPDVAYEYVLSQTSPSHIRTRALGPNGNQIDSYEIFDGLLRPRQSQTITEAGKRMISDTQYDARGLQAKTSVFYNASSAPTSTLVTFNDVDVDRQTRFVYDGRGRVTDTQLWSNDVLRWSTVNSYGRNWAAVIPPAGGTATMDVFDDRGNLVAKRQYHARDLTAAYDTTTYGYDLRDQLTTVTDPAGNQWTYEYDLLGRKTKSIDPDAGTSTTVYDDAGQIISTTDARGQALFYEYDLLGRKTAQRDGSASGPVMAAWTYDTVDKGQLTASTRYIGADQYQTRITSRDDAYRPLHTEVDIPNSTINGALAATYSWDHTYKVNGAPATTVLPGAGGLPAETLTYTYDNNGFSQELAGTWAGGGSQTYINDIDYYYDGLVSGQWLGEDGARVRLTNNFSASTRRAQSSFVHTENPSTPGDFGVSQFGTSYTYDDAGNITSIAGTTDTVADQQECFTYDHLRRLTEAWTQVSGDCVTPQRSGADPYWRQWTFDSIGNRLTQTDKDPVAGDTTWAYHVGAPAGVTPHQLKQVNATGPKAGTPTRTFGYDPAGNMTTATTDSGVAQTLAWDKEGHLESATEGTDVTSYIYDADGRRLISRTPDNTTLYLPDGTELELSAGGGPVLGTRYYGSIGVRNATGLKWTCSNHQGTSTIQIDATTLTPTRRRMLPYGEDRSTQPSGWMGTKGYVGGTKDTTSYTHLGAREYDPT